jgi:hypothetical protein
MPESERAIKQQRESDALATEELAIERREEPRSSRLIDENELEPFDRPVQTQMIFYRRFIR